MFNGVTQASACLQPPTSMQVAPGDSISLITLKEPPSYPLLLAVPDSHYDAVCRRFPAGGIIGLGTLVSAFGLGPIVHFFTSMWPDGW